MNFSLLLTVSYLDDETLSYTDTNTKTHTQIFTRTRLKIQSPKLFPERSAGGSFWPRNPRLTARGVNSGPNLLFF